MLENSSAEIRAAVKKLESLDYKPADIKKEINSKFKQEYLSADANGKIKIRDAMNKAYKELGYTAEDADKVINGWKKK